MVVKKRKQSFYILQQPVLGREKIIYGDPKWGNEFGSALWHDDVHYEDIICPRYPDHNVSERHMNLKVILPKVKIGDFIWTWYSDCLAIQNVIRVLKTENCTGFALKPVEILPKTEDGKSIQKEPELSEILVTGEGGDAAVESGIRLLYKCPHCGLRRYSSYTAGLIVDEESWDGSDFFTIAGYPKSILVTEKVKQIISDNHFTNCMLICSEDREWGPIIRPEDFTSFKHPEDG
jgi:hypothetical protein